MELTNKYNIPAQVYYVIKKGIYKPQKNIYRVTELVGPSMIRKLQMENWDKISSDVSESLWSLLGQSVHYILGENELDDAINEERLRVKIKNIEITGQSDCYNDGTIEDWKITSVYSFLFGEKPEWVAQLNMYAFLWESIGFEVKKLKINAILRDWQKSKAINDDYPRIPFASIPITLWDYDYRYNYIMSRIDEHLNPKECNEKEKWTIPTKYAVKKQGRKTALRVLDNFDDAERYIIENVKENERQKCYIEKRPGDDNRCKDYCPVRKICPYNRYNK